MGKRDNAILDILTQRKKIDVAALAMELGVSEVTIRKDLTQLEEQGVLRREHGFALLRNPNDVRGRLAYHHEAKLRIAQRATELVQDGETIMIENGSCCALLAKEVAHARCGVHIITNSIFIADFVCGDEASANVTLLGGNYQKDARVNVGPLTRLCASEFMVDKLFVGADGFVPNVGFTNRDALRAETACNMAAQARNVIVLTESEKFAQQGVSPLRFGKAEITVVTDGGIDCAAQDALSALKINLITV